MGHPLNFDRPATVRERTILRGAGLYYVADKTDGERAFLVFRKGRFTIQSVHGSILDSWRSKYRRAFEETTLDGEYEICDKKFTAFDIVQQGEVNVKHLPYHARRCLADAVCQENKLCLKKATYGVSRFRDFADASIEGVILTPAFAAYNSGTKVATSTICTSKCKEKLHHFVEQRSLSPEAQTH